MKRILFLIISFGLVFSAFAQDDPIVMHVNGQPVPRSEFEYNYNKNNSEGVLESHPHDVTITSEAPNYSRPQ